MTEVRAEVVWTERQALRAERSKADITHAVGSDLDQSHLVMSWAEYQAGAPCKGCGRSLLDGRGGWYSAETGMTPEDRVNHDREFDEFRSRHSNCRAMHWCAHSSRTFHCNRCCGVGPPMSPAVWADVQKLLALQAPADERKQDVWEVTLRCGHVLESRRHADADWDTRTLDCPQCDSDTRAPRGVLRAVRTESASARRTRAEQELAEVENAAASAMKVAKRAEARARALRKKLN